MNNNECKTGVELSSRCCTRKSSLELLRIISMIMIVFYHYACHGGFEWSTNELTVPHFWYNFISIFNIFRNCKFTNHTINYLSGMSLLIYIIHENLIIRTYIRPSLWNYIYNSYGYRFVIGWVFVLAGIVFVFGLFGAIVYTFIIKKIVLRPMDKIYDWLVCRYLIFENRFLKLNKRK